ncbi:DUF2182 domain-containing protein [Knoellia sp. CPCC 206450]|uniref:copper chaperone n=1 Tax=Knoellia tibetensis TaxID=3404798 RepID=UPI003B430385
MTTLALRGRARGWERLGRPDRRPALWLTTAAVVAALAWVALSRTGSHHAGHHVEPSLARAWSGWALMVVAMMLPTVNPVVCRVAAAGLWARRRWTVAEFVGGFLAPWLGLGLVAAVLARAVVPGVASPRLLVAWVLVVAALWHVAPPRRALMRRCGVVRPGALTGRRATVDAARNGWRTGIRCVATCGPAMSVMALSHSVVLMAGVTAVLWSERLRGPNPGERAAHPAQAAALFAMAAGVVALG